MTLKPSPFVCISGIAIGVMLSMFLARRQAQPPALDLVIANGRVIDPETKLDAVRNVGIKNGTIAAVSTAALKGQTVVDATGGVETSNLPQMELSRTSWRKTRRLMVQV